MELNPARGDTRQVSAPKPCVYIYANGGGAVPFLSCCYCQRSKIALILYKGTIRLSIAVYAGLAEDHSWVSFCRHCYQDSQSKEKTLELRPAFPPKGSLTSSLSSVVVTFRRLCWVRAQRSQRELYTRQKLALEERQEESDTLKWKHEK